MCGSENPLIVKAELFVVAAVTVTLAPLAVKVPVAVPLDPTVTLPSGNVAGETVSCPTVDTPVPETGIVNVGFVAVEVTATFPLTAPADVGTNETLKVALFPALSVRGVVMPLKLNPAPAIATFETDMLDPPVLVIVSCSDPLLPTLMVPKLRLVGLAASAPGVTPVADTGMVRVEFVALELTVTLPLTAPAAVGTNETLNVAVWPPLSVNGAEIPLTLKPAPVIPTCDTVMLEAPVLVMVSGSELWLPIVTLPKLRLVGFALSAVNAVPETPIVNDELGASEAMVTVPLAVPLDFGAKVTVNVALWDIPRLSGVVIPLVENAVLSTEI